MIALLLLLLLSTPAHAEVGRHCVVASVDNTVQGCYNVDPLSFPLPGGTYLAPDPGRAGSPGYSYNQATQAYAPPPLTPQEQAEKDANDARDAREGEFKADTERQTLIDQLKTATPAQIDTWVNNNVQNLADARRVLKMLIKVLAIIVRE